MALSTRQEISLRCWTTSKLDEVHVIGSSAGGPIAILFAAIYPERTRSLVLAGTAANLWPDEDPVTRIVKEQREILDRLGAAAAWDNRPTGVELSLDVLWEREEMKERGVLTEYEDRITQSLKQCTQCGRTSCFGMKPSFGPSTHILTGT